MISDHCCSAATFPRASNESIARALKLAAVNPFISGRITRSASFTFASCLFMQRRLMICGITPETDSSLSSFIKSACTSTPITISAPNSRATSVGKLFNIPPSTSTRSPVLTGVNTPGIAMLARIACTRFPPFITISSRWNISAATQANGIGNCRKSRES